MNCKMNNNSSNLIKAKKKLTMNFFSWDHFYVENICTKSQGQRIYTKKDIQNPPTCVVVRNNFTTTIFDTIPRVEFFLIYHEYFFIQSSLYW